MDADTKIARAKSQLITSHPFFGAIALRLRFVEKTDEEMIAASGFATMATDGSTIYWCQSFVDKCTKEELVGVIVHEAMHVALKHPLRMHARIPMKWNIACDLAINPLIVSKEWGFILPQGGLMDPAVKGMTAEEIYNKLPDDKQGGGGFGQIIPPQNADGSDMTDTQRAAIEAEIDQIVESARIMAKESEKKGRGNYPGGMDTLIEDSRPPQVDWTERMRRVVGGEQPDDYSYRRINRRMFHMYRGITPGIVKTGTGPIVVGIDTSGSVSGDELAMFLSELRAITEDFQPESVTIIQCDATIQRVDAYERGEIIDVLPVKGRGGTLVTPVFRYIEDHDLNPETFIYFSDMEVGDFPKKQPPYPVLWVNSSGNGGNTPPWGEMARLWRNR